MTDLMDGWNGRKGNIPYTVGEVMLQLWHITMDDSLELWKNQKETNEAC